MNDTSLGILKKKKIRILFLAALAASVPITVMAGVILGSADVSLQEVGAIIGNKLFGGELLDVSMSKSSIIWDLRMPRMLLAIAIGGGLAVCGVAMQAITQNVLAEPYILGVSSGASAMVALAFFLRLDRLLSISMVPLFAFLGALGSLILVYSVASARRTGAAGHLILAGMAISVLLNAMTNFLIAMLPNESSLKNVINWMWGSLANARWSNVFLPMTVSIGVFVIFYFFSNAYNLISLGSDTATSFGVDVKKITKLTLFFLSIATGIFVSACGLVGFVGFIIPHIVRILVGSEHRRLFPYTFLMGAVFLALMDILSRNLFAPREMAVGIFSAFVGSPFFIFLLFRKSRSMT